MSFEDLYALADRASLFVALRQDQLVTATDALGEHRWDVDLAEGVFAFTANDDPSRRIEATPHLLASIAPGPRSLMWSWALPQGDPSGVTGQLRAYGEANGIPELTQAEVPFPDDVDDPDDFVARLSHIIGHVAVEITGKSPYYSGPSGRSRAVLLLDAPLPPLTVSTALITMPRILSESAIDDHRMAVWDLARLAGWRLEWADEAFSGATVSDATGSATFSFDEQARITGIQASLGAAQG